MDWRNNKEIQWEKSLLILDIVGILDTKLKILSIQELISVRAPKETGLFYKTHGTLPWCSSDDNSWHKRPFHSMTFVKFYFWLRGSNAYFTLSQNHYRYSQVCLQLPPSHLLSHQVFCGKTLHFDSPEAAHTTPVSAGITLLLSLLTQSHELLVECHLPGTAHNRKPWQRLLETFGCYSSVNQRKLRK